MKDLVLLGMAHSFHDLLFHANALGSNVFVAFYLQMYLCNESKDCKFVAVIERFCLRIGKAG